MMATIFYLMTLLTSGANITFAGAAATATVFSRRMTRAAHHSSRDMALHQSPAAANLSHTAHAVRRRSSACNKY